MLPTILPAAALTALLITGPACPGPDVTCGVPHTVPPVAAQTDDAPPVVRIAILLDTSGSMSGLLDQARAQLWSIVNDFILAEQHGRPPRIAVALYRYGSGELSAGSNWIERLLPFTDDLDAVSERLFSLRAGGSAEYCGAVIRDAVDTLDWGDSPDELRLIFIAGNEPFTQGDVDPVTACADAGARGIIVNPIYCGPADEGIATGWRTGAALTAGAYASINHDAAVVHTETPFDREIIRLGEAINRTYIPYGVHGAKGAARQLAEDAKAASISACNAASRQAMKQSATIYGNSGWDLVDAVREETVDLDALGAGALPEHMRAMAPTERRAYIAAEQRRRADLQATLADLDAKRRAYLARREAERSGPDPTLGAAIRAALRAHADAVGLRFAGPSAGSMAAD